jgi:hypothetical protein
VEGEAIVSTDAVSQTVIAEDLSEGIRNDTSWGALTLKPLKVRDAAGDARPVGDSAVVFRNTHRATDLTVRPTVLGFSTYTEMRSADAPELYSWRIELAGGQVMRELPDGHVAILAATPEARHQPRLPDEPDATPDLATAAKSIYDGEAQINAARDALASAGDNTNGFVVAVVDAPWARDAEGKLVPAVLDVDGDVLTMHVDHRQADIAYPVVADPDLIDCVAIAPCGRYDGAAAAAYTRKWSKTTDEEGHLGDWNPSYPVFRENDCTNFLSQGLRAGNMWFMRQYEDGEGAWWMRFVYLGVWDYTRSWTVVDELYGHLLEYALIEPIQVFNPKRLEAEGYENWKVGDIIFYRDPANPQVYYHASMVTRVERATGEPSFGQHSKWYSERPWSAIAPPDRVWPPGATVLHVRPTNAGTNIRE